MCYPIYLLHNVSSLTFPWSLFLIVEMLLHLISIFYVIKCMYITISIQTFHKNMTILVVTFSVQWFEVVVANALSWPYETGWWTLNGLSPSLLSAPIKQWWTDDLSEMIQISHFDDFLTPNSNFPFFIGGFIKLHYLITMSTVLIIISVERCFASWYLNDYEKKSRIWIAVCIIAVNQCFNFLVAVGFYFRVFHFVGMVAITMLPNALGLFLVVYTRHYNLRVTRQIENFSNPKNYTLAARYQAKENVRCFQMISNVLIVGTIYVSCSFVIAMLLYLNIFPNLDTFFNVLIQISMSFGPLILCPTMIHSVDSWRKFSLSERILMFRKAKSIWKTIRKPEKVVPIRRKSTVKNELIQKETEVYFNQLNSAWM